jgi:hypothetical protein
VLVRAAVITGRVTDAADVPLIDVSITSLRTGLGATTNASGHYRMVVPSERITAGPDTLRFERLGYATTDVPYTLGEGEIRVDATMPVHAITLDEIFVTGTAGNQQRRAQGAVIDRIDAEALMRDAPIQASTRPRAPVPRDLPRASTFGAPRRSRCPTNRSCSSTACASTAACAAWSTSAARARSGRPRAP